MKWEDFARGAILGWCLFATISIFAGAVAALFLAPLVGKLISGGFLLSTISGGIYTHLKSRL